MAGFRLLGGLEELLRGSDLNVVNFEAPVRAAGTEQIDKVGPCLFHEETAPKVLEDAGFNVITLANNHAMDYGAESLLLTKGLFKNCTVTGAGTWNEAYQVKTVEVGGKTLGFLGLTHNEFGVLNGGPDDGNAVGTAWMLHPCVDMLIADARKKTDYLFILPHAGVEHEAFPLPELRMLYRHFVDLGADGVFASHPHIPQGWETYRGKPIFYSLGNFCLDPVEKRERPFLKYGLMVSLELDPDIKVNVHFTKYDHEKREVSLTDDEMIVRHFEEVTRVLNDNDQYLKRVNAYCDRILREQSVGFARSGYFEYDTMKFAKQLIRTAIGRREKPNPNYLINLMRCESHRWAILRALENRNKRK